jgi:hypothetical protein
MAEREEPTLKLDAAVRQAIAACDGDAEVAVRWLIVANNRLAQDLEYALQQTSWIRAEQRREGP